LIRARGEAKLYGSKEDYDKAHESPNGVCSRIVDECINFFTNAAKNIDDEIIIFFTWIPFCKWLDLGYCTKKRKRSMTF